MSSPADDSPGPASIGRKVLHTRRASAAGTGLQGRPAQLCVSYL